ncbi:DUF2628 domain-containing protein [Candidatus Marinimicrobia bacterium]|nr:DUF2628 domain-containing protein [Candidatus Neomarinimicrobiota bacterium]
MIFKENIDNSLESIGSGNKTFVVYKNSMNTVELVKYGWSWFAFLFSGLWLVYKGLYIKAVEIFVFSTLILLLGFPESIIPIISTGIGVYIGACGNSLYKDFLEKSGYQGFLLINANTIEQAKRHFSRYMDT